MRLPQAVRSGGKLALMIGFLSLNLVFSSSLTYYYGYSDATFGVPQSSDPFGNQNVSFAAPVSMVSAQAQTQNSYSGSSSGSSALATSYGYAAPSTLLTVAYSAQSSSSFSNSSSGNWGAVTNNAAQSTVTFSAWNPMAGTGSSSNSFSQNSGFSNLNASNAFSNWSSFSSNAPTPSVYAIVYSDYTPAFANSGGWQAVNMSVTPRVANSISTPTTPAVVGPPPVQPTVNLRGDPLITVGAPEPGTMLTLSAGLALVFLKLRRR